MSGRHDPHPDDTRGPRGEAGGCWVLSREAVREVDRLAVERYGIPSIVLMENAAIGLCTRAVRMMHALGTDRAVVLAGPGNNGGDGFALARHLANAGMVPTVLLACDPAKVLAKGGDAATNLAIVQKMAVPTDRLDRSSGAEVLEKAGQDGPVLVVDALLGTGLRESPRGVIADVILQVNRLRSAQVVVLAVDVPSGLDCDTGEPAGAGGRSGRGLAIEADETVTFVALKPGMLTLDAQRWTGEVSVAGIGVPRGLIEELGECVTDARRDPHPADAREGGDGEPPASHGRASGRDG